MPYLPQYLAGGITDRPVLINADAERNRTLVLHPRPDVLRQLRGGAARRLDVSVRRDVEPGVVRPNRAMRLQPLAGAAAEPNSTGAEISVTPGTTVLDPAIPQRLYVPEVRVSVD